MSIALLLATMQSFAQTDPLREKLDSIFYHINKAVIPTGYLKENGAEQMPIHCYNGLLTDSNFVPDFDAFRFIYTDLSTAKIQAQLPEMPSITLLNQQAANVGNTTAAPIVVLYGTYASLRPDALTENLFTVNNEQIFDVAGRTQDPYLLNTLFAAASTRNAFKDTVAFTWIPTLYYTNTNSTIVGVWIDFRDGQGYNTLPANGMVSKIYTDSSGVKGVDIKVQLSNGEYLYCHSSIEVTVTIAGGGYANRYMGNDPNLRNIPVPVVAGENLSGDMMQIRYSVNNATRTSATPHLLKPIIYVEGYDVENNNTILTLISQNRPEGLWVELLNNRGYDFMHDLDDVAGYDLVYINYNTLRSIEQNSLMLQHAIEWIRGDKVAGGSVQKNVIIGTSAGGILARYTLARMTKNISSASTDTRLLITHDSPHQGANVPLSFQYFLYDIGNVSVLNNKVKDKLDALKNFFSLNLAPATAQLLLARVTDENGTVAMNTFLTGSNSPYHQMVTFGPGDNVPDYRFIATAQGSQCGVPVMPVDGLLQANHDGEFAVARYWFPLYALPVLNFTLPVLFGSTKYYLKTQLNALPASGTSPIEYFKFSRRIAFWGIGFGTKTLKEETRPNPPGFTRWDAAPGSTQSIIARTKGSLSTGLEKQDVPGIALPFLFVRAGLSMNITQDLFSFVSTISALDAPIGTPLNMNYVFPATGTTGTATEEYIAQESFSQGNTTLFNQNHTAFTARNARWLYNEMENLPNNTGCEQLECNAPAITLLSTICPGNKTYQIANNNNRPVTWSVQPQGSVTLVPQGNGIQVIRGEATGNVDLIAQFTNGCGQPQTVTITLNDTRPEYGPSGSPGISISDAAAWCPGTTRTFTIPVFAPGLTYNWQVGTGSLSIVSALPYTNSITVLYSGGAVGAEIISVTGYSPCDRLRLYQYSTRNFPDLLTGTITSANGYSNPLNPLNRVPDNNAMVTVDVATGNTLTYTLTGGLPQAWGAYVDEPNTMFVYNQNGGTFDFNVSTSNSSCNTTIDKPFTVRLNSQPGSYNPAFSISPNPVVSSTNVTVRAGVATTRYVTQCLSAGGFISVKVMSSSTGAQVLPTVNGRPGRTTVAVDMSTLPTGQVYIFVINATGCANGVYQEVQQVLH